MTAKPATLPKGVKKLGDVESITILVAPGSLVNAPFNPPGRTQLKEMNALIESIRARGFIRELPILAALANSMVIDGHRRKAAAVYLQLREVPVTFMDGDPDDLWAMINGTHMTVTGNQVMQAYARGMRTRPTKFAALMARLEDAVGPEGMRKLGERGTSPHIINHARSIARYCGLEADADFVRRTVFWLAEHARMNTLTQAAMREGAVPSEIERAVRKDIPLTRKYGA